AYAVARKSPKFTFFKRVASSTAMIPDTMRPNPQLRKQATMEKQERRIKPCVSVCTNEVNFMRRDLITGEVASMCPEMRTKTICMAKLLRAQNSFPQNPTSSSGECGVKINEEPKTTSVKSKQKTNASGK